MVAKQLRYGESCGPTHVALYHPTSFMVCADDDLSRNFELSPVVLYRRRLVRSSKCLRHVSSHGSPSEGMLTA